MSSRGAPVLRRRTRRRLRRWYGRAVAGEDLGAADQQARIDAERPADQAEDDDRADAEAAAADRKSGGGAAAAGPSPRRSSMFSLWGRSSKRIDASSSGSQGNCRRAVPSSPLRGGKTCVQAAIRRSNPYGYSNANGQVPIFHGLKSFFTLSAAMIGRVGCQVFASPTAYPSDSSVMRVSRRGASSRAPRSLLPRPPDPHPCRRLRRRNGGAAGRLGRSRLRRSALQPSAPGRPQAPRRFQASTRSTTTGTSSRASRPMTISPAPG